MFLFPILCTKKYVAEYERKNALKLKNGIVLHCTTMPCDSSEFLSSPLSHYFQNTLHAIRKTLDTTEKSALQLSPGNLLSSHDRTTTATINSVNSNRHACFHPSAFQPQYNGLQVTKSRSIRTLSLCSTFAPLDISSCTTSLCPF